MVLSTEKNNLACVAGAIVSAREIKFWWRSRQASGEAARRMQSVVFLAASPLASGGSAAKTLGNLSKPRPQRQRERRKTKGLMSRTIAVHVRYKSLYISLPFSAKQQREMTRFCVFWRTYAMTANILDSL